MARLALRLFLTLLIMGLGAAGILAWGHARYLAPGPLESPLVVIIEPGSGVARIARSLASAGVLDSPALFRLGVWISGSQRSLRAGEYAFPAAISLQGINRLLKSGKTIVRRLTVAEGLSVYEVMARLAAAEGLTGNADAVPAEGTLLPETYHYAYGDSRAALVGRMAGAMAELIDDAWPRRASGLTLRSPEEAIILASIVEKETGRADERARIAAVFLNRLRKGMRLQSDPTVVYGLTGGASSLGRPLTRDDLKQPSPYNTYRIDGLPPGPISNPGRAAIEAVLHPADSDDLYFVADGTGGHAFARTLKEHNRNAARWRRLRPKR